MVKLGINWITQGQSGCVRALHKKISVIAHFELHQFSCKREVQRNQHCELLLCNKHQLGSYLKAQINDII